MEAAHSKSKPAPQTYRQTAWHMNLQAAILFTMLLSAPVIPRFNAAYLVLLAILSLADLLILNRHAAPPRRRSLDTILLTVAGGFTAYLFLNALWARDIGTALGKAALVALILGTVFLVGKAFSRQTEESLHRAAKAVIWGALIGFAIALFEYASDHLLRQALFKTFPAIRSESNSISIFIEEAGSLSPLPASEYGKAHANEVIMIHTDGLNRNLSLVLLYLWAILAITLSAYEKGRNSLVAGTVFFLAAAAILTSASQTAQFALLGGVTVFALSKYLPKVAHWLLVGCWCVALIFTLPIASAPYNAGLHKAEWLFPSARDRIAIWSLTSELAQQSPILGVGIRSTRYIGREMKQSPEHRETYAKPRRLGIHAHNHFLQIWFELGAVGAAFILALGLALLTYIRRLENAIRPFGYAAFATAALIAAFGWGLWQTWLLVGFGATVILFQLANNRQSQSTGKP